MVAEELTAYWISQVVPGFNWDADADAFNFHHTYCSKEHLVSQAYLGDEATMLERLRRMELGNAPT